MQQNLNRHNAALELRGDWMSSKSTGRRVPLWPAHKSQGFSLIELVITITVLTILTLGIMPLVKVSVRRQKEQQLREALRQMRTAIDEFHRDTIGMNCSVAGLSGQPQPGTGGGGGGGGG